MNRYGVLAHYIECFAQVTGQMQYDLFHVFTVDQHTLFVIRNISRFKQDSTCQTISAMCPDYANFGKTRSSIFKCFIS